MEAAVATIYSAVSLIKTLTAITLWFIHRCTGRQALSLEDAARRVYEKIRDKCIEGIISPGGDFVAAREMCIVVHASTGNIRLSGIERPSTKQKQIPSKWCEVENLEWDEQGNVKLMQSDNGHGFCQIRITNRDLRKHIRWVRCGMNDT